MIYRFRIPGMKPVLVRDTSKAKAVDQLVEIESLTAEEMQDALEAGEKVFKAGDRVEAEPAPKPEAEPEKAPE